MSAPEQPAPDTPQDAAPDTPQDAAPDTPQDAQEAQQASAPPALQIVSGRPTPEQTAALVAVLAAVGSGGDDEAQEQRSLWSDRERAVRSRLSPGPGAWRASGLPR